MTSAIAVAALWLFFSDSLPDSAGAASNPEPTYTEATYDEQTEPEIVVAKESQVEQSEPLAGAGCEPAEDIEVPADPADETANIDESESADFDTDSSDTEPAVTNADALGQDSVEPEFAAEAEIIPAPEPDGISDTSSESIPASGQAVEPVVDASEVGAATIVPDAEPEVVEEIGLSGEIQAPVERVAEVVEELVENVEPPNSDDTPLVPELQSEVDAAVELPAEADNFSDSTPGEDAGIGATGADEIGEDADPVSLESRLAEIEQQLTSALKEVRAMRRLLRH